MAAKEKKTSPTWTDVKGKLAELDRAALLGVVHELYAANKDNRLFLHTRFELGGDVLAPYKTVIDRWISPDVYKNQQPSVSTAKKAISDFKKAAGQPLGLAELMVYYCELAAAFSKAYGMDDPAYLDALMTMFGQALEVSVKLSEAEREAMLDRLDDVRTLGHDCGHGVGEYMDSLLADYDDD